MDLYQVVDERRYVKHPVDNLGSDPGFAGLAGDDVDAFDERVKVTFDEASEETFREHAPLWVKITLPLGLVAVVLVSFALGQYSVPPP